MSPLLWVLALAQADPGAMAGGLTPAAADAEDPPTEAPEATSPTDVPTADPASSSGADAGESPAPQDQGAPTAPVAPAAQPDEGPASEAAPPDLAAPPPSEPASEAPDTEPTKRRTPVKFNATGHVKSFGLATFPYEHPIMPDAASGSGVLDGRLALSLQVGKVLRLEAAHAITARLGESASPMGLSGGIGTGVGVIGTEAVKLSWTAFGDGTLAVSGRTDRLIVRLKLPHVDVTLGRQPITFGSGMFFTPLDLVNPFTPTTIDTEVKPGVDAIRVDGYVGVSTRITAVAAYAGAWEADGLAIAAAGQTTVGVTDLGLLYGFIHGDHVIGATVVSGIGPVGVHGDAALTIADPDTDDGVYFRGVLGAGGMVTSTTSLSGEVYVQTLGTTEPSELFVQMMGPRYGRGELWLAGLGYYGLALDQEIVPVLHASLALIGSFTDASHLLTPSLRWSVSDNAEVAVGGFVGLGKRPGDVQAVTPTGPDGSLTDADLVRALGIRSEFGTYPGVVFTQVRAYF
jgi:hypothetical protein